MKMWQTSHRSSLLISVAYKGAAAEKWNNPMIEKREPTKILDIFSTLPPILRKKKNLPEKVQHIFPR